MTKPDTGTLLRLAPASDLTASTVEAERATFHARLDAAEGPVSLDLSGVREIDSLGITLILGLFKSCQKKGLAFSVEGVSPDILRVFKLFSLPKLFPISEAGTHGQPG